jgi:PAS domain S-box-containing protein
VTRAGEVRWVSHSCRRIVEPDGSFLGLRGSHADITERKRIEQALRESEERLAEAVRIARLGSWRLDLQSGEMTVSSEHLRMMGESDDPPAAGRVLPIAEYIRNYIHPDDHPAMQERYEFVQEHGRDSDYRDRFEYRLLHRDGSTRTLSVSAHAVPGERRLVHGIAQDITERKEAERAFAELSRWHEQILNSAGEGILGLDREGRQVFVNPAAARMLGFERAAELVGRPSHALWHHSHADSSPYPAGECPIYDSLKDGHVRQLDTEVFWHRDGTCFPAAYTSTPIFEAGGIAGAVVVFEDITERKRAEEALRESEARLQAIIESEPECVKLLDREGRVLEMNPAGLAMLEAEASQVLGRRMRDMVLANYREAFDALTARVFDGQPGELEFEIEGVRARRLWLDTRAVPLRSAEGEIVACLGVTRDITERKRIQQQTPSTTG